MSAIAFRITSLAIVYSSVYSGADQRKHQSPASLAFVQGIHWWPVNSPHKWPVTRKIFSFDDVIMVISTTIVGEHTSIQWIVELPQNFKKMFIVSLFLTWHTYFRTDPLQDNCWAAPRLCGVFGLVTYWDNLALLNMWLYWILPSSVDPTPKYSNMDLWCLLCS